MTGNRIGKINKLLLFLLLALVILLISSQITIYLSTNRTQIYPYINKILKGQIFNNFSIIFISIVLDAFPFIMIGVFVSSIIQVFVSEETIARFIPKNKFLGLIMASLVGIVFPLCDCAVVPVARRFAKKGVPIGICVTFLLSAPIVNPISIASTCYAFADRPVMVLARIIFGILTAIIIGYIMQYVENIRSPLKLNHHELHGTCGCVHDHFHSHDEGHCHEHGHSHSHNDEDSHCHCHDGLHKNGNKNFSGVIGDILDHISIELYDVGKYLIFGAFVSAIMQTIITKQYMAALSSNPLSSIFAMQVLAFLLSICSTADAFIAKTFLGQFTSGSIIAFLIFGPMLDIKNILMLSETFTRKFLIKLVLWIGLITFFMGVIANTLSI